MAMKFYCMNWALRYHKCLAKIAYRDGHLTDLTGIFALFSRVLQGATRAGIAPCCGIATSQLGRDWVLSEKTCSKCFAIASALLFAEEGGYILVLSLFDFQLDFDGNL